MACYEFMGMMISKMVYKEGIKAIQHIVMTEIIRDSQRAIHRQKMGSMNDCVGLNDLESGNTPLITLQLNSPHPHVCVRLAVMDKPVDQSAGKVLLMVVKRKEKENMSNFHAFQPRLRIIKNNKNSVMAWITIETGSGPDQFMPQAASPTKITRGIEDGDSRVINLDFATKLRAILNS
jgi:hypothetical protein